MSVSKRRIAVLGTGKIGEALIKGLCASGWREPAEIVATDIHPERLQAIKERCGVETSESNREAVEGRRADRYRRQAAGSARACAGDRRPGHERADGAFGRGRSEDGGDREASGRRRAGGARDAEHPGDRPGGHGRNLRRRARRRRAHGSGRGGAHAPRRRRARARGRDGRSHGRLRLRARPTSPSSPRR